MSSIGGINVVPLIIAASGLVVTPANLYWPLHRALIELPQGSMLSVVDLVGDLELVDDHEIGKRSTVADESFQAATSAGVFQLTQSGLLARWVVKESALQPWRRMLLTIDPAVVVALGHWGKRWATLSATVLKNLDSAAESWASMTAGEISVPMDRKPLLRLVL